MGAALAFPRRRLAPAARPAPRPAVPPQPLRGVHLLNDHSLSYEPSVEVNDVLEVDFDQQQIGPDGLYLITYPTGWGGVRRFQRMPVSGLHIFEGDKWVKIHDGHRDMQVIGRVLNVYRRTR